jgi:hypothetical protein
VRRVLPIASGRAAGRPHDAGAFVESDRPRRDPRRFRYLANGQSLTLTSVAQAAA